MNSMKPIVVLVILAAAGYWMYMNLWQKPASDPTTAQGSFNPPTVQIPGLNQTAPQLSGVAPIQTTNAAPTLLGSGSPAQYPANPAQNTMPGNTSAANLTNGFPPSTDPNNVTLLAPPGQTNNLIPQLNTSPNAPVGTTPTLLNGATAGQTPTATYPSSGATSQAPLSAAPLSTSPSDAAPSVDGAFQNTFIEFINSVQKNLDEGRLTEAHLALSSLYSNPNLPDAQARQLTELLDQLAGTVIYSRQNLLEQPYVVRPGDTLDHIAKSYDVSPILLARINGIRDPHQLEAGQQLKVLHGPFNAVIRLEKHELSLSVDGRYAGRFPIGIGCDQPKLEGEYTVREKNLNPDYHGPGGMTIPGGDPRNPLGKFWIGLSDNVGLHGTVDPTNIGRDDNRGTICLGERDIDDLYGILSVGSKVKIQR